LFREGYGHEPTNQRRTDGGGLVRRSGAKRTRRTMAAAAEQESALLQLRERCRAQRPPRSARWASCERAELPERCVGSAASPSIWTGGRTPRRRFPGRARRCSPSPRNRCGSLLRIPAETVGQRPSRESLIRAMGACSLSDSRGDRALASAHTRATPTCSASGAH